MKRQLSVPEKHQLKIARDTLRMPDAMAGVMGGPTKAQARQIIKELTGRRPKENPGKPTHLEIWTKQKGWHTV